MVKFEWTDAGLQRNAVRLGESLAKAHPHLYRTAQGLIEAVPAENRVRVIDSARKLAPVLIDHLDIQVKRGGKIVGDLPQERSLNAVLGSELFLRSFRQVDVVTFFPVYLADFSLAPQGYHDGGPGQRILSLGPQPRIAESMEAWNRFLAVIEYDTEASRTNTIAAALTVLLRHLFPGQKALVLVTANQSHAGKGTEIDAIRGPVPKAAIMFQAKDWPMQSELHKQLNAKPVKNNFLVVQPNDSGPSALFLWAILNSPIACGYMARDTMSRDNSEGDLSQIPVPRASKEQMAVVETLADQYRRIANQHTEALQQSSMRHRTPLFDGSSALQGPSETNVRDALLQMDAGVIRLFGMPARIERQLLDYFRGHERRGVGCVFGDYYPAEFEAYFSLSEFLSHEFQSSTVEKLVERQRPPSQDVLDALQAGVDAHSE